MWALHSAVVGGIDWGSTQPTHQHAAASQLDHWQAPGEPSTAPHTGPETCLALMGVFVMPGMVDFRAFMRRYTRRLAQVASGPHARCSAARPVRFVFVVCDRPSETEDATAQLEQEHAEYGDMFILRNEVEAMNTGKSFSYFVAAGASTRARAPKSEWYSNLKAEWYFKMDADTFVNMPAFVQRLQETNAVLAKAQPDAAGAPLGYLGRKVAGYMVGMLYGLTRAAAELMAEAPLSAAEKNGAEDGLMGGWVGQQYGKVALVDVGAEFVDHPYYNKPASWAAPLSLKTVAVHQVKTRERYASTLCFYLGRGALQDMQLLRGQLRLEGLPASQRAANDCGVPLADLEVAIAGPADLKAVEP
jgi:hypothetical protein